MCLVNNYMAKSKTWKVLLICFLVLLVLGTSLGVLFWAYPSAMTQSVIPSNCYSSENFQTDGSFTCPSTASSCSITVSLDCKTRTDQVAKVIARVKDPNYGTSSHWIVLRNEYDQLESWYEQSVVSGIPPSPTSGIIDLPYDWKATKASKTLGGTPEEVLIVPNSKEYTSSTIPPNEQSWTKYSYYRRGGSGNTNPEPVSNCQNQEICSGTIDAFSCSQTSTGDLKLTISGSQSTAWSKTNSGTLASGKSIYWVGKIIGTKSYQMQSECTQNMPVSNDPSSYYECKINPTTGCGFKNPVPIACPSGQVFDENTVQCKPPYSYEFKLDKTSYAIGESATGTFRIYDSTQYSGVPFKICIEKISSGEKTCIDLQTKSDGRGTFTLAKQTATGTYKIYAHIDHPSGVDADTTPISVFYVEPFSFNLYATDLNQGSGDVEIYAVVTDAQGQAKRDVSFLFTGTTCGTKEISNKCNWALDSIKTEGAYYKLICSVSESCLVTFIVKATDSTGYTTPHSATQTIQVETQAITIQHSNSEDFQMPDEGSHTFEFNIMDSNLNPISSPDVLTVQVQDRGGCLTGTFCNYVSSPNYNQQIPSINPTEIAPTGNGRYKFTHTFGYGANHVIIHVEESGLESNTYDEQFYFWQTDTPAVEDPTSPTTFPVAYIVFGAIIVIGLIIFFVIILGRKKKKK